MTAVEVIGGAAPPRVVTGLSCPSCGGTIDVQEGWTNVLCRYCETPLVVLGERGVGRLMVLDRVDRVAASRAVRGWFAKGIRKEPALKRDARFEEAFLAWFPFVRARLDVVGWVLGIERRRVKRGNKYVWVEEPKELQVERPLDRTVPAAEMAEFGVGRVNLAGDQVVPLDEEVLRRRGMVFRPSRAPAESAEQITGEAVAECERTTTLDHTTFSWLTVARRRISVVYYPLWVFRYSFQGRTYQALIDAEDGTLAYGKAPGNHLYRACTLVAASAGACFIGTTVLQHLGSVLDSNNGFAALAALGLAMAGLVGWGYRQFRRGGVVEEGSGCTVASDASLAGAVKAVTKGFR